ncbi:MAG: YitT family protein [Clostridia bacterium]|nr:YitT family protein [Clostridia bacterium]
MEKKIRIWEAAALLLSSAVLAFGLYEIHSFSGVTEGGVLGAVLLLEHWFGVSPAITGAVLNTLCYLFGIRTLGKPFLIRSAVAAGGFSLSYYLIEMTPPLFPHIAEYPLAAALCGAVFVGVTVGICVLIGGAPSGDDALAMSLSKRTGLRINWIYLFSDLTVLLLSLTYIPFHRIMYSLLTVVLSGLIIGWMTRCYEKIKNCPPEDEKQGRNTP